MTIYDELAERFGYPLPRSRDVDQPTAMLPAYRPSLERRPAPAPQATPPADACARCGQRDPYALLHRHLDEVAGSLHARQHHQMEALMSALDNLRDQIDRLEATQANTVLPALAELASREQGIPEADVQVQADRIDSITSAAASAAQTALQGDTSGTSSSDDTVPQTVPAG